MSDNQPPVPATSKTLPKVEDLRNKAKTAHSGFMKIQAGKKAKVAASVALATAGSVLAPTRPAPAPIASVLAFPDYINEIKCGMVGGKKDGKNLTPLDATKNPLKNRFEIPDAEEIDSTLRIDEFLSTDETTKYPSTILNENMAATVTGYIVKIIPGGGETCNCQTINTTYHDTHIYLSSTDPSNRPVHQKGESETRGDMIVEVTPRMRQIVKPNSTEWTTDALKKAFPRGTKVTVTGWQFYDREHEPAAYNINHKPNNWRYSCWELHPVTAIDKAP